LGGAIGLLGVVKILIELASGRDFGLQQVAFYIGATAFGLYIGVAGAFTVFVVVGGLVALVMGGKDPPEVMLWVLVGVAVTAGIVAAAVVIFAGVIFDFNSTDTFGRFAVAIIGIATLAGAVVLYGRLK